MRLKIFYTHLKRFPFGDVFSDFEYSEIRHLPGFLRKKKRYNSRQWRDHSKEREQNFCLLIHLLLSVFTFCIKADID